MGTPTSIRIGCHTYSVLRKNKTEMPKVDGDHLDGCCDYDNLRIYIRKGLRRSKAREYLLHEVIHACTYPALNGKILEEEEWVDKTSPALLQVLQDNPDFVEFLQETL